MKTAIPLYKTFFHTHPEEAARLLETMPFAETLGVIAQTHPRDIANLLANMNPTLGAEILLGLHDEDLSRAAPEFSPVILANLIVRLVPEQRSELLKKIPESVAKELTPFFEYPADSAGSLMDPRVLALPKDLLVEQAIGRIRVSGSRDMHEVYVVERDQRLVGRVPL